MNDDVIGLKPPIGLKPRFIHNEQRLKEVKEAMERYYNAGLVINIKWIEEYNELIEETKRKVK